MSDDSHDANVEPMVEVPMPAHFRPRRWNRGIVVGVVLIAFVAIGAVIWITLSASGYFNPSAKPLLNNLYPVGIVNAAEPSGMSPPGRNALPGYSVRYVKRFTGTTIPPGWDVFTGIPGGDPDGQFAASHVEVNDGLLQLNTWRDPAYGNKWVTGGICQCGLSRTYGAYFVRSRITGPGPNEAELLWPTSNNWPPEIDFNETGNVDGSTTATVHYGPLNNIDQLHLAINMTQWHTFGVIWTPTLITYVVDGEEWGEISTTPEISTVPMTLDFEQRTSCRPPVLDCPTGPQSLQINWVAEYNRSSGMQ